MSGRCTVTEFDLSAGPQYDPVSTGCSFVIVESQHATVRCSTNGGNAGDPSLINVDVDNAHAFRG